MNRGKQLLRQEERATTEEEVLARLSEIRLAITSTLNLEQVLTLVVESAVKVTGADIATLYLYDQTRDEFHSPIGIGLMDPETFVRHASLKRDKAAARIVETRQPIIAEVVEDHPEMDNVLVRTEEIKSTAGFPLMWGDSVVGVLFIHFLTPHQFTEGERVIITTFASQAAIAIQNARLFYELRTQIETLSYLREVGQAIIEPIELSKVLSRVVESANKVIGADVSVIFPYDQNEGGFPPDLVVADGVQKATFAKQQLREDQTAHTVIESGLIVIEDLDKHLEHYPFLGKSSTSFILQEEIKSFVGISLRAGEEVVGILYVNFRTPHYFSAMELDTIKVFANQAAIAIQNARLFERTSEELEDRVRELEALQQIDKAITSTLSLEEILNRIIKYGVQLTGAGGGDISLLDEINQELAIHVKHIEGFIEKEDPWARIRIGEGITGHVARTKRSYLCPDVRTDTHYIGFPEVRSELAVPILSADRLIGIINVEDLKIAAFDEDDERLLEALAEQAAIAIQNAERYEALQEAYGALEEEQERRIAAEKLATLGQASTALAHRLNNLIGIVPVCVEELFDLLGRESALVNDNLETIDRNAKLVLQLVSNLLKPFRLSTKELFDVNLLSEQAISVANIPSDIKVTTEYTDGLPKVRTDRLLIDVFVELITNAVKAMRGEGKLTIRTRLAGDKWVEVWFTDTGCGIPTDKQSMIFDLFVTARKPDGVGTSIGLGLWWVKTFLQEQGGDAVLAWSEVNKGSSFVVRLPTEE